MPTSKVIRPAVFDETGEHVIPADADLNLDPVSSDPDNYIVRGSDGGAFLNGDGVLSNDGENLLKTSPNDGKVTYPRSDAVDLIRDTMQAALDAADERINNAQDAADKAQATADKAAEDAAAAQCAAGQALDKAQEAIDKLPEIADAHSSIVTAGDGIKVAESKLGDHNVYQVSVKRNGDDSGLISSTDGLEVELKGNGGLDKDKDGLYVDQQWIDEMVARYAKDHMLFNQIKVVRQLPAIPDADVHTIYLIRNKDSSATDAGTKDSFDGWIIVTTENGTQKWEEVGYKTDLTGYTHTGNTVNITGYVSGTGTVDSNGNVTVDVVANIKDTPYTYYVGKTNARDYWGKDENGNMWGSTQDHPFASLGFAINQSNSHVFPGNTINIIVLDAGEYDEGGFAIWHVTCNTIVRTVPAEHPRFRGSYEITLSNSAGLSFFSCDFYQWNVTSEDQAYNGVMFIHVFGDGTLVFCRSCHMIMDSSNFGKNWGSMLALYGNTRACFNIENAEPALYMELRNGAACPSGIFGFGSTASIGAYAADSVAPANIVINAPAGTKFSGSSVYVERAGNVGAGQSVNYVTGTQRHTFRIDWNIADDSDLTQVYLDKYSYLDLPANPVKGQKLPGHAVGTIRDGADYAP